MKKSNKQSYTIYVEIIGWCYGNYYSTPYTLRARSADTPHIIFRHAVCDRIQYKKINETAASESSSKLKSFALQIIDRLEAGDRFLAIEVSGRDWVSIQSYNLSEEEWANKAKDNFQNVIVPMRKDWKSGPYSKLYKHFSDLKNAGVISPHLKNARHVLMWKSYEYDDLTNGYRSIKRAEPVVSS